MSGRRITYIDQTQVTSTLLNLADHCDRTAREAMRDGNWRDHLAYANKADSYRQALDSVAFAINSGNIYATWHEVAS